MWKKKYEQDREMKRQQVINLATIYLTTATILGVALAPFYCSRPQSEVQQSTPRITATETLPTPPTEIKEKKIAKPVLETYVVRWGQTLGRISNEVGVSIEELVEFNNIAHPDTIYMDQRLRYVRR